MKYPLYFIVLFIGIYSCKNDNLPVKEVLTKKKLANEFATNFKNYYNNSTSTNTQLDTFYNANLYHPIWFNDSLSLNKVAKDFLKILANANQYGLEPKRYSIYKIQKLVDGLHQPEKSKNKIENAVLLEKLLTENYFIFGKHLNYGLIENVDSLTTLPRKKFKINLSFYLLMANKKDSIIEYLLALQPKQEPYKRLQKGLVKFFKKSNLSKEKVPVESIKLDSLNSIAQARKALVNHQYISKNANDSIFIEGLKKFQYDHGLKPDGVVGKNTAKALSKSPYAYYQSAAASLERWRWKPQWENDYIYVNIPSYKLIIKLGDTVNDNRRVVVGSLKNKTPEVYSKLSYIVAYPFWNVPKSISVKEILVKQKKDTSYINKHNYEIFDKNLKSVSSLSVKWDSITDTNFNYYFRQKGGNSNALGLVKFIFDNKYAIYLHDTPSKYYFYKELRAYSHGCVRVQNALEMANTILKYDENKFTIDSIWVYIKKNKEKKMILTKKIPVYIQYIVCDSDKENNIIFNTDIYKKDEELIKLLFED